MKKLAWLMGVVVGANALACSGTNPVSPALVSVAGEAHQRVSFEVTVPGTSNPWLAYAPSCVEALIAACPPGARSSGFTPGALGVDRAPHQAPVRWKFDPTLRYRYTVTGCVTNNLLELPCHDANGGPVVFHYAGAELGVDQVYAPLNALVALREGASQLTVLGTAGTLAPGTEWLILGTMDGWEWNNNGGAFVIRFFTSDEPSRAK